MKGANSSTAMGLGVPSGAFSQTLTAVPAEDSCATMGWQVSVWLSTSIFQLQRCI